MVIFFYCGGFSNIDANEARHVHESYVLLLICDISL
jgi:hypothetical protein